MFADAIRFLKDYRTRRVKALRNEEPQRWFASGSSTLPELFDTTFSATDENTEWEQLTAAAVETDKVVACRIKIAMLAGMRHDLRSQFAVGEGHDVKEPCDFDRHSIGELRFASFRNEATDQVLQRKAKG